MWVAYAPNGTQYFEQLFMYDERLFTARGNVMEYQSINGDQLVYAPGQVRHLQADAADAGLHFPRLLFQAVTLVRRVLRLRPWADSDDDATQPR